MVVGAAGLLGLLCPLEAAAAAVAPEFRVREGEQPARPGKPYLIECEVTWSGGPGDYVVLPAEVDSVDWGAVEVKKARSFVRDGENVVVQTVAVTASEAGDYETPEIRIGYMVPKAFSADAAESKDSAPVDSQEDVPMLRAASMPLAVRKNRVPAYVTGAVVLAGVLTAAGWWFVVQRRRDAAAPAAETHVESDVEGVRQALRAAARRRVRGDYYAFYQELSRIAATLPDSEARGQLQALFDARAKEIGYKGVQPSPDQMDGDVRAVERVLKRYEEDEER